MSILKSKTSLKKAPKVKNPRPKDNYMKESDSKLRLKSPMFPLKTKRLSK